MCAGSLHETVLESEAIQALEIKAAGNYIDATFGRGGHSKAILSSLNENRKNISIFYTIKKGDTIWDIAQKYNGISVSDIKGLNSSIDVNNLKAGTVIKLSN